MPVCPAWGNKHSSTCKCDIAGAGRQAAARSLTARRLLPALHFLTCASSAPGTAGVPVCRGDGRRSGADAATREAPALLYLVGGGGAPSTPAAYGWGPQGARQGRLPAVGGDVIGFRGRYWFWCSLSVLVVPYSGYLQTILQEVRWAPASLWSHHTQRQRAGGGDETFCCFRQPDGDRSSRESSA